MLTPLKKAIIATLNFFDIYDFPLTLLEVHRYLYKGNFWPGEEDWRDILLSDVLKQLETLKEKTKIESKEGFYFLPGRKELVEMRAERYLIARKKYKKTIFVCEVLSLLPGVLEIYVTNTLAYSNTKKESDIDLLIVTHPKTLWTTRLFCVGLIKLFRMRPKVDLLKKKQGQLSFEGILGSKKCTKERFCLSFFLSVAEKDIKTIMQKPFDPYLLYWIAQTALIFDKHGEGPSLVLSNRWIKHYLPNAIPCVLSSRRNIAPNVQFPMMGLRFEVHAMLFQKKILPQYIKDSLGAEDLGVVINNQMLKFHVNDKRSLIRTEFERRLKDMSP